jgi:hypothetical protein
VDGSDVLAGSAGYGTIELILGHRLVPWVLKGRTWKKATAPTRGDREKTQPPGRAT